MRTHLTFYAYDNSKPEVHLPIISFNSVQPQAAKRDKLEKHLIHSRLLTAPNMRIVVRSRCGTITTEEHFRCRPYQIKVNGEIETRTGFILTHSEVVYEKPIDALDDALKLFVDKLFSWSERI